MPDHNQYNMSEVAPHKRHEVLRRIEIVESYLSGDITSRLAVTKLGMSVPSFWRLLRAWRKRKNPGDIDGSGRNPKEKRPIPEDAKRIIEEAELTLDQASMAKVVERAIKLGRQRGITMPTEKKITTHAKESRRSRGLRPTGISDLVLEFCAIDIPAQHPVLGPVLPIMCVLVDVRKAPIILGLTLEFEGRTAAQAARTIYDAIARAETMRTQDVHEFQLPDFAGRNWDIIEKSLTRAGFSLRREEVRARRSARQLAQLIGLRPAGILLLPDLTVRPPTERLTKVKSGAPVELLDAEEMLRGRLYSHFIGKRETISNDPHKRGQLAGEILRVAATI